MSRGRRQKQQQDAIAVGAPALALADEEREAVADVLAELLLAALERGEESSR